MAMTTLGDPPAKFAPRAAWIWRWVYRAERCRQTGDSEEPGSRLFFVAYDAYGRSTGYTERIGSTDYTASVLGPDSEGKVRELRYPSIDATAATLA